MRLWRIGAFWIPIVLISCGSVPSASDPAKAQAWKTLLRYQDKALEELPREEWPVIDDALQAVCGGTQPRLLGCPWRLTSLNDEGGRKHYVFVEGHAATARLEESIVRFRIYDADGAPLIMHGFKLALFWRRVAKVRPEPSPVELLSLDFYDHWGAARADPKRPRIRLYFGLLEGRLWEVRTDDRDGKAVGFPPSDDDEYKSTRIEMPGPDECLRRLRSGSWLQINVATAALAAYRDRPEQREQRLGKSIARVRGDRRVQAELRGLTESENAWIREGAALVLRLGESD